MCLTKEGKANVSYQAIYSRLPDLVKTIFLNSEILGLQIWREKKTRKLREEEKINCDQKV